MANTFSQIFIHVVFTVKGRDYIIAESWKDELYKFITGIIKKNNQKLMIINGVPDHIHILLGISPEIKISDLIRDIKSNSSRFINEKEYVNGKFQWQEGYGVFSCSYSQINKIIQYIKNQENHHKKSTFKEEYIGFLHKLNIEYNEKYLFHWIE
jgi:putative transposase